MTDTYNSLLLWIAGQHIFNISQVEALLVDLDGNKKRISLPSGGGILNDVELENGIEYDTPIFKSVDTTHVLTRPSIIRYNKGKDNEFSIFQYTTGFYVTSRNSMFNLGYRFVPKHQRDYSPYQSSGYQHSLNPFCIGSMGGEYQRILDQFGVVSGNRIILTNMLTDNNPDDSTWSNSSSIIFHEPLPDFLEQYVVNDKVTRNNGKSGASKLGRAEVIMIKKYVDEPHLIATDYKLHIGGSTYSLTKKEEETE